MTKELWKSKILSSKDCTNTAFRNAFGLAKNLATIVNSERKPCLFVTHSPKSAEEQVQNFRFLLGPERKQEVLFLPSFEKTPYHQTSPDPMLVMERLSTLNKIATGFDFKILVTAAQNLVYKTLPLQTLQNTTELLELKGSIHRDDLVQKLELLGYNKVQHVEDPGTFAVRGSIIDIFWPGLEHPVRIDLFGNQIDRIHSFNPDTQHTLEKLRSFQFGPVKKICLTQENIEKGIANLRELADELNFPTRKLAEKIENLENGIPFFGIERLLPAFTSDLETPLKLFNRVFSPSEYNVVFDEATDCFEQIKLFRKDFEEHFDSVLARNELCYPTSQFLCDDIELEKQLQAVKLQVFDNSPFTTQIANKAEEIDLETKQTGELREAILKESARTDNESDTPQQLLMPLARLIKNLHTERYQIFLPVNSKSGLHRTIEILKPLGVCIQPLERQPNFTGEELLSTYSNSVHAYAFVAKPDAPTSGIIAPTLKLAIISEAEIFGKQAKRKGKSGSKGGFKTTLADLEEGDPIVHIEHGIGLFKGLAKLNVQGVEQDYIHLVYQNNDKLYLPVHHINLLQNYAGTKENPRLDKLGGTGWQTKKKKVKQAVLAMAQDLLNLYARRELANRPVFNAPDSNYLEFEAEFPFETTPDQQKAIDEVVEDMKKERPMDRLVCGDVGYGKTEVAMRAAMLSVLSKRQVAVLAPTTVLAQQHSLTFQERFKKTGATIEVISRFQKPSEIKETLNRVKYGQVDILIGTHRILSSDVNFKDLGLVIVDEEQRFGIKHKEHLKKMRCHVDILTLSATPIPRTLEMGFFGVRDLSIIETPPVDRRSIRTSISQFDDEVIREAIIMELKRQGQVYFVHNKVSSIEGTADYLRKLVPEAKIEIGHGQMHEKDLEKVMIKFMNREFNVLVCTTIIETGIDVPQANTMFIDNADDFGLAQLYQLRGRIGRSKDRAFAYLLIPSHTDALTPIARKRLEILHRFSELGAGFRIAQHDLELRGAGDMLGKNQHGHVAAVGYDLYSDLLKQAVLELKGKSFKEKVDPEIKIPKSSLIPDTYISDLHDKMGFYQKLVAADSVEEIWDVIENMSDQYGETPDEVNTLAEVMILKNVLKKVDIVKFEFLNSNEKQPLPKVIFTLSEHTPLDPKKISKWLKKDPERRVLTPALKLVYTTTVEEWEIACNQNIFDTSKLVINQILNLMI